MTCEECWWDYPKKHKNCGGLVHCHFLDENWDSLVMNYYCDKCEESGEQLSDEVEEE